MKLLSKQHKALLKRKRDNANPVLRVHVNVKRRIRAGIRFYTVFGEYAFSRSLLACRMRNLQRICSIINKIEILKGRAPIYSNQDLRNAGRQ